MRNATKMILMATGIICIAATSCKKDDKKQPTLPSLTTTAVTDITPTTAISGGTIGGNGGAEIISSGICWSKTNATPTTSDDTAKTNVISGSFTANLKNLSGGSSYYVRAYATNGVGTGYGNTVTFTTGNAAPQAKDITVTGDKAVGAELTAAYIYFDAENDAESGTTYQWYAANDSIGSVLLPIGGATEKTYTLTDDEKDKFIIVGIVPKSSAGTNTGTETKSFWLGPIGGETVTFVYNGQMVTYGVIKSIVSNRKWMDRNLGAVQMATSYNDYLAYGDLFQCGRLADGHQLINWTATDAGTPVNNTTEILSTGDVPVNSLFIIIASGLLPSDWRVTPNNLLWQAPDQLNNPCPTGWRVPTNEEWDAENLAATWPTAFDQLKLTAAGSRRVNNGELQNGTFGAGRTGLYWSSTVAVQTDGTGYGYRYRMTDIDLGANVRGLDVKGTGYSCRCIKNE